MERSATPGPGVKTQLPDKSTKSAPSPHQRQNGVASNSLSFAQRKAQLSRPSKPNIVDGNNVLRSIERPPPGDKMSNRRKSLLQPGVAKRRSAYYENEFAVGREVDPTKDRVRNEAIVLAELRTNVMIQDEFTFITDLSYQLSNRYQRSISSIAINLQHGCCMMFGGSFDPAYTLTIFALPNLVQPTTNKRNAALIQNHLQESLGVTPSRGYVRFVVTPEEDVASGGKTVAGELDELEKASSVVVEPGLEHLKTSKSSKRLSVRSFASLRPSTPGNIGADPLPTPPASTDETPMISTVIPEHPPTPPAEPRQGEKKPAKMAARRKSFVTALFGSKASSKERRPKTSAGPAS